MNKFLGVAIPLSVSTAFLICCYLLLKAPTINRENSIEVKGVVNSISRGGIKDIVIGVSGIRGIHYISHTKAGNLDVSKLEPLVLKKEINLRYMQPGILSRLNPMTETRQIVELKVGDRVIYSELK